MPKWQFQFILLKHLRASCCSDEPSSVPAGNVSDPGKTEVLGGKGISLNREKKMYFKVLEPWAGILARILWDPGVQKRSIIKDKLGISDTMKWKGSYFCWIKETFLHNRTWSFDKILMCTGKIYSIPHGNFLKTREWTLRLLNDFLLFPTFC